jgi:uncharacterized damage-inducible protein DinB
MSATRYFRAQAYNNAWSNHRLIRACASLSADELAAPRVSFFRSLIHTLNHILTVDWYYLSGLEGKSLGSAAFEPEIPCASITDLAREQQQADQRLIDFCEQLTDPGLSTLVHHQRRDWVQTERADRTLLHLFQHQIHHRGQVHAMLSGTAVAPPQLDEFFLGHEKEQALRAGDFSALGFAEDAIWR